MSKLSNTVMFACNQGGHFSQVMALKQLFGEYDTVLISDNILAKKENTPALKNLGTVDYAMSMANRREEQRKKGKNEILKIQALTSYVVLFAECIKLWKKYRPAVIISTGSNIAVPFFLYGKLRGSKLIFIETRAKVYSKTLTGKIVGKVADWIFVQWPEMKTVYPNAEYCGTLV